jgi:siderophore synthetase component
VTAPRLGHARGPTADRAAHVEAELAAHEPQLVALLRQELPGAMGVVAHRLASAALREGIVTAKGARVRLPAPTGTLPVRRHGFGRVEPVGPVPGDPVELLDALVGAAPPGVREELRDAAVNLALALARNPSAAARRPAHLPAAGMAAHGGRPAPPPGTAEGSPAHGAPPLPPGVAAGGPAHGGGPAGPGIAAAGSAGPGWSTVEAWGDADEQALALERLATEGHNLHPCGRTRLGWRVDDVLAHDLESPVTSVGFLAVRLDLHVGDELARELLTEDELAAAARAAGIDPSRYAVTPVHPWQRRHVLRGRYRDLAAQGAIVPLDAELPALVTSAVRTLLVPGTGRYVKLSLDIQITSTRRTISVASTRNGPLLSRLLPDLVADDRVLLMPEAAGSAVAVPGDPRRQRDLAAIIRGGLSGRLRPGEVPVPGSALPARHPATGRTVVASLVDQFAQTRGMVTGAALGFVTEYARLLLGPVLTLATRHGIGLEAHLQNCIPTFVDGVPHRLAIRDLAGMRVHAPRLAASVPGGFTLWPGSVTITDNVEVMRAKFAYTALQAHLGEVILRLVDSHGLDEARAWVAVRSIVDEVADELARLPGLAQRALDDHAFLTAPMVPHKALLTMRLRAAAGDTSDHHVPVPNALWRAA